jgi:hypothetical protein
VVGAFAGEAATSGSQPAQKRPRYEWDGTRLTLVYFTGSKCAPCRLPEVKAAVLEAKRLMKERAAQRGVEFASIGVAIDDDPSLGLEFMKDVGPFDQVAAGGEFGNFVALETMAKRPDPFPAIPLLLVFEQTVETVDRKVQSAERKYLASIPGTGIPLWVKYGAKLSDEPEAPAGESRQ